MSWLSDTWGSENRADDFRTIRGLLADWKSGFPLVAFIEENREDLCGDVERGGLYNRYAQWCRDAGHEPQSRTKFIQSFRATARQVKLEFGENEVFTLRPAPKC